MTRSILKRAAPAAIGLLAISPVHAQEPLSWDYASMSLLFAGKLDNGSSETIDKGFRLDVARSFQEHFFFRGKAELQEFDERGLDTAQVGAGAKLDLDGLQVPVQIFAGLNYERLNFGGVSDGIGIDLGVRSEVAPDFEAGLTYKTANLSGAESIDHEAFELSLAYTGPQDFDVIGTLNNASLDNDEDADLEHIVGIGIRFPF